MTVTFDYEIGAYITEDGALRWMNNHIIRTDSWIRHCFSEFDIDHAYRMVSRYPVISSRIIRDYFTPDKKKLERIAKEITEREGMVYTVVGDRGSGKTCTATYFMERAHKEGRETFIAGPPQKHPRFMIRIKHPLDCPQGGLVLCDESAIKFFCRDFMYSEQRDMMKILNTLRHTDRSIIFCTQTLAATDKMITVGSDRLLIKRQGVFTAGHERKEMRDIIQIVKPRHIKPLLYWTNTGSFTFIKNMPLPECWKEAYSKPYTSLASKPKDAWDYAEELKEIGYAPFEIVRELKARSFKVRKEEVEARLWADKSTGQEVTKIKGRRVINE